MTATRDMAGGIQRDPKLGVVGGRRESDLKVALGSKQESSPLSGPVT